MQALREVKGMSWTLQGRKKRIHKLHELGSSVRKMFTELSVLSYSICIENICLDEWWYFWTLHHPYLFKMSILKRSKSSETYTSRVASTCRLTWPENLKQFIREPEETCRFFSCWQRSWLILSNFLKVNWKDLLICLSSLLHFVLLLPWSTQSII